MVKEEIQVEDVEEGEISDTASIEEISEQDFNKQDAKDSTKEVSKPKAEAARVWTMQDLYRYQVEKGYTSGLHNLAWAQAVQKKKPLCEVATAMEIEADDNSRRSCKEDRNGSPNSGREAEKVVIDDSGDESEAKLMDVEKEEGELEEGEIDLDSEVVGEASGDGGEESAESVNTNDKSGIHLKEDEVERRLHLIQEALDSVMSTNGEISFEGACYRLQSCLESLREVVLVNSLPLKDALVELFLDAIRVVHSEFCSMDSGQKETNEGQLSRLLSLVKSDPSFLSSEQAKEIEDIMCSLNPLLVVPSTKGGDRGENTQSQLNEKNIESSAGTAAHNLAGTDKPPREMVPAEVTDQTSRNITSEALKHGTSGSKTRGILLPLLDLHKDHDEDSLPSPTRQAPANLSASRALPIADGLIKAETGGPTKLVRDTEALGLHPYETDAVRAVSTYQQKFARSSFSYDKLPSPTPSEDDDNGVDDTSGEVSSSRVGNSNIMNSPVLGRPSFSSLRQIDNASTQGVTGAKNLTVSSSSSTAPAKSSAKSRDPRLRFANPESGNLDLSRPSMVINSAPNAEPVGGNANSRKQRNSEDPAVNGHAKKKLRNGLENSGVMKDVKTGGWLEETDAAGFQAMNRSGLVENASDLRTSNGVTFPSVGNAKTNVTSGGIDPLRVSGMNAVAALPALLKDIAVNPTMLVNLLKMSQQQKLAAEAQQNSVDPLKNTNALSSTNSILGAAPKVSLAPPMVTGILQNPAVTLQSPGQIGPVEELGKIRMKPRDPRRFLHGNALQRSVSSGPEQLKHTTPVSRTQAEDQADRKALPSDSTIAPDTAQQFTKNLKSIFDPMPASQSSTSPFVVSQNLPSLPIPSTSGLEVKTEPSNLKEQRVVIGQPVGVSAPGPLALQCSWGDVDHLFEGYDDQQRAAIQRERARRIEEQRKMFAARKLCLVLDLDHTLLNSAKFIEVDPKHDEILRKKEEQDREKPQRHLFRFAHMGMWTKLRPGIWNFLEKASKLYELHLYTMGNKLYATEMAKVLDPKGVLFAGRVISRGDDSDPFDGDERFPKSKDLEGVLGMESGVVIIDDSVRVWPHNKLNLIVVERYTYFPCSRRQFGLLGPSLLEIDHDERPEDGTLASSLAVIERIHQTFFSHQLLDDVDVRNILAAEQRKILAGCRIVFSRVFPVGEANPHLHPLWQTAEQFGAVCTNQIDEQVTHVVANSLGTDKVNWALSTGRFVVHPGWVEASALLYRRVNEQDFAIKQ